MAVLKKGAFRFMRQKMEMPGERIAAITNASEKNVLSLTEILPGQSYLLAAGRLIPLKGLNRQIRMSAEIAKLHP